MNAAGQINSSLICRLEKKKKAVCFNCAGSSVEYQIKDKKLDFVDSLSSRWACNLAGGRIAQVLPLPLLLLLLKLADVWTAPEYSELIADHARTWNEPLNRGGGGGGSSGRRRTWTRLNLWPADGSGAASSIENTLKEKKKLHCCLRALGTSSAPRIPPQPVHQTLFLLSGICDSVFVYPLSL